MKLLIKAYKYPSPLRYPGGKSWLIPTIRDWLSKHTEYPIDTFSEPFAGGANVGLAMLLEGRTKSLHLAELDNSVAAFWDTVLNHSDWLIEQIKGFPLRRDVLIDLLTSSGLSKREQGFVTLLRNRTARGGIIGTTGGLLRKGENGNGVFSRWYPETLSQRIQEIAKHRDQITLTSGDGFSVIENNGRSNNNVMFLDPPYSFKKTSAGHRLYRESEVSFEKLIELCRTMKSKYVLCYEDCPESRRAASILGAVCVTVKVKNSHNKQTKEIIISNDSHILELKNDTDRGGFS